MSDRLVVLPGPGTVVRFGRAVAWAGPSASAELVRFLDESVRNVGASPEGGRLLADHLSGILSGRDPEPGAPFGALGPAGGGWVTVLHGPVQLWDGRQWLAPSPTPGWLRAEVHAAPGLGIGPVGQPAPDLSGRSPWDLTAGTVPGGGLVLLPGRGAPLRAPSAPGRALAGVGPARPTAHGPGAGQAEAGPAEAGPAEAGALTAGVTRTASGASPMGPRASSTGPGASPMGPGAGPLDLRGAARSAGAPLPPVGDGGVDGDGPTVEVRRCTRGHGNHPALTACWRCGTPVTGPATTGTRPPLGLLIGDDGRLHALRRDAVVGAAPGTDPAVAGGSADGLLILGEGGSVAAAHAELRTRGWEVTVTDRGSQAGTYVTDPGGDRWRRLAAFSPVPLLPGSHLSVGQRILTFVSPWPTSGDGAGRDG